MCLKAEGEESVQRENEIKDLKEKCVEQGLNQVQGED